MNNFWDRRRWNLCHKFLFDLCRNPGSSTFLGLLGLRINIWYFPLNQLLPRRSSTRRAGHSSDDGEPSAIISPLIDWCVDWQKFMSRIIENFSLFAFFITRAQRFNFSTALDGIICRKNYESDVCSWYFSFLNERRNVGNMIRQFTDLCVKSRKKNLSNSAEMLNGFESLRKIFWFLRQETEKPNLKCS